MANETTQAPTAPTTADYGKNALAAGLSAGAAGATINPVVGLITGLAAAGISAWATYEGGQRQQAAYDAENTSSRSAANMQNAYTLEENKKDWAWKSDERDYQRGVKMAADIIDKINQAPAQHASLINLWSH
jgi:hypothetical protein